MNTPAPATLGNVIDVDPAWVAKVTEEALEPSLPIVDPHHHLWQRAGNDYMFHDLLADTRTGHNIVATVFVDCHSMYRKAGSPELRCVGESEFANGVAAMCASGLYGGLRACAAIVSHVDLRLGAKAGAVFDAQMAAGNGRFIGIRYQTGLDKDPGIRATRTNPTPGLMADKTWREGFRELDKRGLTFDSWTYHPQLAEVGDLAAAVLFGLGMVAVRSSGEPIRPIAAMATPGMPLSGNTEQVGWMLYTSYLIPFEIASMLLLVAMIGAIVLAKREL